jgi:2-methylfumaryl-CoA isomerase
VNGAGTGDAGPLAGLTVIEIATFVAGPSAGLTLAQLGARVVRVDPLGGAVDVRRWPVAENGQSLYWSALNRGKQSITIDLRSLVASGGGSMPWLNDGERLASLA